ncbi:MAG TPA: EamA family transporter [Candidatus Ozemobacteraceae bacterium]
MLYVILTIIFWGIPPVLDKLAIIHVDTSVAVFVRTAFIAVLTVAVLTATGKWGLIAEITPRTALYLGVSGLLSGCLGVFTYLQAMKVVQDAGKVAVLTSTYPLVALLLTMLILHEKLTATKIAGSLLITVGIVLLNL